MYLHAIRQQYILRVGLGLAYLYSSYHLIFYPTDWAAFLPLWLYNFLSTSVGVDTYLRIQGFGEFVIALAFLLWFVPRKLVCIAAVLSTLEFLGILLLFGIDVTTFRDIGLLAVSIALLKGTWQKQN